MKVVDLFCGCGGMGLGFQQAGFEIVYACDFDKYAVQSYRHNIGDHVEQRDIRTLTGAEIPKADVWTFGFPCQDVSVAGKQAGMEVGTRSGLFYEVMRLLDEREDKPSIIMAENVKGLKPYLNVVEQEFAKRGYKTVVQLYNSKYWGVPQNRERYYIVGILNNSAYTFPNELKKITKCINDVLEDEVDQKHFINRTLVERFQELHMSGDVGVVGTLKTDAKGTNSRSWVHSTDKIVGCISATDYKQPKQIVLAGLLDMQGKDQIRRVHDPKGISPTVTAVQGGHHHHVKIINDLRIRRLTPREYARLQGFPDNYEIVVSDTQAYKQFGNSVTVPLVKAIAESIKAVLSDEPSATES